MQAVSSGATPRLAPLDLDSDSIPPEQQLSNEPSDTTAMNALEVDVQYLIRQARLWRASNAAIWAAWGVVQAKVPGMEEGIEEMALEKEGKTLSSSPDTIKGEENEGKGKKDTGAIESTEDSSDGGEEEEFDYLAYSQDRIMFFWADMLSFGLVKEDELPPHLLERVKAVQLDY